jgi:polyisoprenoid-binding protein YceI
MAIHAGRHQFGTDRGRITLRTSRDGLAASAGHDLTIEIGYWSAELVVADDLSPSSLNVTADLGSLVVVDGTGGLKPLTDRDKREIVISARKVLSVDRFPQVTFTAGAFKADAEAGGGTIDGTLTLAGKSGPLQLLVSPGGSGSYHAAGTIRQTDFGIKPYSGFLGALKVKDAVEVAVDVDLSSAADQESAA